MQKRTAKDFRLLVRRCLAGSEKAWNEIIELASPVIFSVCRSMRLSREESLDIFGQVCYLLLHKLDQLRDPAKLLSYTATTTRWEITAVMRRTKLHRSYINEELGSDQLLEEKSPERGLEEGERSERLISAILKLPPKEARLIWHLFLDPDEPSYDEIATKIKIPVSSIGPTRARAIEKLKRILRQTGFQL